MSTAKYTSTTINRKTVRYIEADLDAINVEGITSLSGSNKFGVNGTFFGGSPALLTGIAVAKSGSSPQPVGPSSSGSINGTSSKLFRRGTMFHFSPDLNDGTFLKVQVLHNYTDVKDNSGNAVPSSRIKWAIGGLSLHLNENYTTSTQFYSRTSPNPKGICTDIEENASSVNNVCDNAARARTAIGYKAGRKIILAAIESASVWDVRGIMKSLDCTMGISLDGGSSTGIRAKNSSGGTVAWGAVSTAVRSAVTVNPTTWV
ncbi:phosphodiester glycosidase family protein [Paenibacillus sp. FSL M7-0420]|uniref:phosphodiester glycosidase family protein n=1 Tax=Paenibacillus sp. FSL M7-0420 TaxID=2921609 RepID=UPI0030FC7B17